MKTLNSYISESSYISNMEKSKFLQTLKKVEKWNTVANWKKYEKKQGNDPNDIDEYYFEQETYMCDNVIKMLKLYVKDYFDEVSTEDGLVDFELLSNKLSEYLQEAYENQELEELVEGSYFEDYFDYMLCFNTGWEAVTKQEGFLAI